MKRWLDLDFGFATIGKLLHSYIVNFLRNELRVVVFRITKAGSIERAFGS